MTLSKNYEEQDGRILVYKDDVPPVYWQILSIILRNYPKSYSIFEIGSGIGDVLALLRYLGFVNIKGIERDDYLAKIANQKLSDLFALKEIVLSGIYPISIPSPDILLQVNCVYFEGVSTKQEFIEQLLKFYENAQPKVYIVEVIDSTYNVDSKIFPFFVRLAPEDIYAAFKGLNIKSFLTYQYPKNTSTKRLYIIERIIKR